MTFSLENSSQWTYEVGDLVWAKMKGFPPWPGKVTSPDNLKTIKKNCRWIFFFGSENFAWIETGLLKPYHEFKDALCYSCKTQNFKEACKAIERHIEEFGAYNHAPDTSNGISVSDADKKFDDLVHNVTKPTTTPKKKITAGRTSMPNVTGKSVKRKSSTNQNTKVKTKNDRHSNINTDIFTNDTYYLPLADTQCIQTLTELSGATSSTKRPSRRTNRNEQRPRGVKTDVPKPEFSKATTTELVKDVFENMFAAKLDIDDGENDKSRNKLDKILFDDVCETQIEELTNIINSINTNQVIWKGLKLCKGMFVIFKQKSSPVNTIGRIQYLYKQKSENWAHIILFMHSYNTVLGEASDRQEIFALKKCTFVNVNNIVKIVDVKHKIPSKDWFNLGNSELENLLEPVNRDDENNSFFFQQHYDEEFGRFEYPKIDDPCNIKIPNYCSVCENHKQEVVSQIPKPLEFIENDQNVRYYYKLNFNNESYKIGNFVYLTPGVFLTADRTNFVGRKPFVQSELNKNKAITQALKKVDETKYTEYYRKTLENSMRGSNETTPDPFDIGEILAIFVVDDLGKKNVKLCVRRMYRAEQIPLENYDKNSDMNMLFWSDEEFSILYNDIHGKCFVAHATNIQNPLIWSANGPDRFYFLKKYDFMTGALIPDYKLPSAVKLTGKEVQVNYDYKFVEENYVQHMTSYDIVKPLRGLDIFAGCGGLSRGLEDSGLIKSEWAIENDDRAAAAFKLNNPDSTVFVEDCNFLL